MLRKLVLTIIIICWGSLISQAQKSKVIAAFQLIETGKYAEAKKAIEEAIEDDKTWRWPKAWYARGLLCQTAYRQGIKDNDKKKYELYPDQLYVAFDSYQNALKLDKRGRLNEQVAPMYVLLANDLQKLGEKHFQNKKYEDALKAFEYALQINQSSILSIHLDSNLIYNTALAAYKSKDWDKAIKYLHVLNENNYSSNVAHLLFTVYIEKSDTTSAEEILVKGIEQYEDNKDLVLLLVDLLFQKDDTARAIGILDSAFIKSPSKYIYPYTKGLVYQKMENYQKAIDAYKEAITLAPDELNIFKQMGLCYYNIGVAIEENARKIKNNKIFREEKAKSNSAFKSALSIFEEAYEKNPDDQMVITKLYQLYKFLGMNDKIKNIEEQIN